VNSGAVVLLRARFVPHGVDDGMRQTRVIRDVLHRGEALEEMQRV